MKALFLFFIIYLTREELVTNTTAEIIFDSRGGVYLNYEQDYVNQIVNHQNFRLSAGMAKVTFDIKDHEVTLLHYFPLPQKEEKALGSGYSPMYGKTIQIGVFRGADRVSFKCTSEAKVREYVKYTELHMRLYTANQVRISQGKDLYISSQCLVIDEDLYVEANYHKIINALYAKAKETDQVPLVAVRWFLVDRFSATWVGLAQIGNAKVVANPKANYWLICNEYRNVEDPNNAKLKTIVHEFGHSCGFHHGALQNNAGVFTTFNLVDNYGDCANIMGNCAPWDRPVNMNQYMHITVLGNTEPWLFKYPEVGVHKYRLYALDHPYSRYFLGTNVSFHNDTDVFDGIPFKYNCMAIRVIVNKTMTSKYVGAEGSSSYIMLEYRWVSGGQKSGQEFGVRVTYGFSQKGNLLQANFDGLKSWGDSEILLGKDYYPSDFDTGTLRIRVTKIHRTILKESKELEIVKEDKRRYDEPGYAELEIEYYPNKKPPTLTPPKDLPNFISSPSFYNCIKNDDSGYNCSRSTTSSGWFYFIKNGSRDKNIPRWYASNNNFIRNRLSLRSFNGADYSNTKVCYGEDGFKCINMVVSAKTYSGVSIVNCPNVELTKHVVNKPETSQIFSNVNVVFRNKLIVPEGGRAYVTDLFGNKRDVNVVNNVLSEVLPGLETDGFGEGAVVVKDKDGVVTYYDSFTFYHQENGNRVSIEYLEDGNFELSPAVMPSDKHYTTTSMLYPVTMKSNEWYNYPITYLRENEFVYIDFKGIIPSNLIMTIESDNGEYIRSLNELSGLTNVSYKLTFLEMHKATGGWSEIDRIKFNVDVEIQNIRPVYQTKIGNQMAAVTGRNTQYSYDGYRYIIKGRNTGANYIYNQVNVNIHGETYSFETSTSKIVVDSSFIPVTSPPPTTPEPTTPIPRDEFYYFIAQDKDEILLDKSYTVNMEKWNVAQANEIRFNKLIGNGDLTKIILQFDSSNEVVKNLQLFGDLDGKVFEHLHFEIKVLEADNNFILKLSENGIFKRLSNSYLYDVEVKLINSIEINQKAQKTFGILSNEMENMIMIHVGIYFDNKISINSQNEISTFGLISGSIKNIEGKEVSGLFVKGNEYSFRSTRTDGHVVHEGLFFGKSENLIVSYSYSDVNIFNVEAKMGISNSLTVAYGVSGSYLKFYRCFGIVREVADIDGNDWAFFGPFLCRGDVIETLDECWSDIKVGILTGKTNLVGFRGMYESNPSSANLILSNSYIHYHISKSIESSNANVYLITKFTHSESSIKNVYGLLTMGNSLNLNCQFHDINTDIRDDHIEYPKLVENAVVVKPIPIFFSNYNVMLLNEGQSDIIKKPYKYLNGFYSKDWKLYYSTMPRYDDINRRIVDEYKILENVDISFDVNFNPYYRKSKSVWYRNEISLSAINKDDLMENYKLSLLLKEGSETVSVSISENICISGEVINVKSWSNSESSIYSLNEIVNKESCNIKSYNKFIYDINGITSDNSEIIEIVNKDVDPSFVVSYYDFVMEGSEFNMIFNLPYPSEIVTSGSDIISKGKIEEKYLPHEYEYKVYVNVGSVESDKIESVNVCVKSPLYYDDNGKCFTLNVNIYDSNRPTIPPTTATPTTIHPTTPTPITPSPTTPQPTTPSPTTIRPTTASPTTSSPTTPQPTTQSPATSSPTTPQPTTQSPTTKVPTTQTPATQTPTTLKPTLNPSTSNPSTFNPTTTFIPSTLNPSTSDPTGSESPTTPSITTTSSTTLIPTTAKPIERVDIVMRISNITDSIPSELSENDKKIIKDAVIKIYNDKKVTLRSEDIEIIVKYNQRLLLRRLENELNVEVIISVPEESTKKEIIEIANKLLNSSKLNDEILSKSSSSDETIFKDVKIEVVRVEDQTIHPTSSNNSESEKEDDDFLFGLSLYVFIGIVGGVAILLIIIIVICCCCLCRSKKSDHSSKSKKPKAVVEKGVKSSGKEIEMTSLPVRPVPPKRRV